MGARDVKPPVSILDLVVVVLSPVIASIITIVFKPNLFVSTFLFFGLPALYLSIRKPWLVKKGLIFSVVATIPLIFIVGYLVNINDVWYVPSILNFRLPGYVSIEDFVWVLLWFYYAVIFYEYFIDLGKKKDPISKNIKYMATIMTSLLVLFLLIQTINSNLLYFKHSYLKLGIILMLIPLITFLAYFPKLLAKYIRIAVYFFSLSILFEISALYANQWWFYEESAVGTIELFGQRFPFEEFFFWFVIGVPAALAYYEFFADDRK